MGHHLVVTKIIGENHPKAPSLISLTLNCENPRSLILETPSISDLSFSVAQATRIEFEHNVRLWSLQLSSSDPSEAMLAFTSGPIQKLSFSLQFDPSKTFSSTKISLESLFQDSSKSELAYSGFHDWFFTEDGKASLKWTSLKKLLYVFGDYMNCGRSSVDDCLYIGETHEFVGCDHSRQRECRLVHAYKPYVENHYSISGCKLELGIMENGLKRLFVSYGMGCTPAEAVEGVAGEHWFFRAPLIGI